MGDERCGDGNYNCFDIKSVYPSANPVAFDYYARAIRYADGTLEFYEDIYDFHDPHVIDLNDICPGDSIVDLVFYDDHTDIRNGYDFINPETDIYYPPAIFILTPRTCYKYLSQYLPVSEIGNSGADSTRLGNASSIDIDYTGRIYISDGGDNRVKLYNYFGDYLGAWAGMNAPDNVCFDQGMIYILDRETNAINEYDNTGSFINTIANFGIADPISCFAKGSGSTFWLIHDGGKQLSQIEHSGNIRESKTDYCYFDVSFDFGNLVDISCYSTIFIEGGFFVVDKENGYLIKFELFHYL